MSQASPTHDQTRVVIVGGGPIGLEVAATMQRAGVDYRVLEAKEVGHTMTWWAPQTKWFSSNERIAIAGMPLVTPDGSKASREQYLAYLRGVVSALDLDVRTFEPVADIQREEDGFVVHSQTRGGPRETRCDAVVLAIGGTDFPSKLGVPGDDLPHVDGYLREPHSYFGRRVLIVGGRNSAIEAALRCHHAGADVALSYRGDELPEKSIKYWLLPEIKGLIKSDRIAGHFGTEVKAITPTHVTLSSTDGDTDVEADVVLSLIGYRQDKRLLRRAGVDLIGDGERPSYDEATMETNVPGLYVAGTAIAGTQSSKYSVYLENCHDHAQKILEHLGSSPSRTERHRRGMSDGLRRQIAAQPES
ncbi:MAG: NAD(P)-binding domain-containing protein [Planctomycetota bacterium]